MKVWESIGDLENENGNLISSDKSKAQILNNFFCSVFTQERTDNVPSCEQKTSDSFINTVTFTKEKVKKKLKNLNPAKLCGPDNINAVVLKELAEELLLARSF